jgi:hypothetical protein
MKPVVQPTAAKNQEEEPEESPKSSQIRLRCRRMKDKKILQSNGVLDAVCELDYELQ